MHIVLVEGNGIHRPLLADELRSAFGADLRLDTYESAGDVYARVAICSKADIIVVGSDLPLSSPFGYWKFPDDPGFESRKTPPRGKMWNRKKGGQTLAADLRKSGATLPILVCVGGTQDFLRLDCNKVMFVLRGHPLIPGNVAEGVKAALSLVH